jgi:hypothetical protein
MRVLQEGVACCRYGGTSPQYRLPRNVLEAEMQRIAALGVEGKIPGGK